MSEWTEGPVTILFTDVEGSTDLTSQVGIDASREILRSHDDLIRAQIEKHQGREIKSFGDGFMLAFRAPRRALECSIDIQRALERHNRLHRDHPIRVRIGLNTGEVAEEDGDLFGEAVNAASRVKERATGGEILVSEIVKQLVGTVPDVSFKDRGRVRLKGFPDRWRIFQVEWSEARAPVPTDRTPFVGRAQERDLFSHLVQDAVEGRGSLVMIGGEPGVGKTRLATEVAGEAERAGMLTFVGRCYEAEGTQPYNPFVEIVETARALSTPDAFRQTLGDSAAEVARVVPELRRIYPDIPAPLELPPEQERHYLLNSLRAFVERSAQNTPLLVVIDDLHWSDESSLLLLRHIAERVSEVSVLMIGTYRDVELDVRRPLAGALEDLLRRRLAQRVSLKRLPEEGVESMLQVLSLQEPPPSLVKVIYEETEGNPFFIEEVYRHLVEEGKLFDDKGRFRTDLQVGELDVPEGVRLVIGRRLARLGPETEKVLTVAAVIGRAFDYDLLRETGEVDERDLLDAIDEAERARLITPADMAQEAKFTFAHELIRQTLLSGVSLPRRQHLHLKVANAIERTGPVPEERAADLAHHLFQAGTAADAATTTRYLSIAGDRAMDAAAFEDALRNYTNALSIQPSDNLLARAEIQARLGFAQRSLGEFEEALETWRQALDIYDELADPETRGSFYFDVAQQLGWAGRWDECLQITGRGLGAVGDEPSRARALLLDLAGAMLALAGYPDSAEESLAEAVYIGEKLSDPLLAAYADAARSIVHFSAGEWSQCVTRGLAGASVLREHGALWDAASFLSFACQAQMFLGDFEGTRVTANEVEEIARRLGHWGALDLAHRANGFVESRLGPDFLGGFREFIDVDREMAEKVGPINVTQNYAFEGLYHFYRGDWDSALENYRRGLNPPAPGIFADFPHARVSLMLAYLGKEEEALQILNRHKDLHSSLENLGTSEHMIVGSAVEALFLLGERKRAAALYPALLKMMESGGVARFFDFRLHETLAGLAAGAAGDTESAEHHFESALRVADELTLPIETADARRFYGEMLIDRGGPGDKERARVLLNEAIDMYNELQFPKHREMAEALLART